MEEERESNVVGEGATASEYSESLISYKRTDETRDKYSNVHEQETGSSKTITSYSKAAIPATTKSNEPFISSELSTKTEPSKSSDLIKPLTEMKLQCSEPLEIPTETASVRPKFTEPSMKPKSSKPFVRSMVSESSINPNVSDQLVRAKVSEPSVKSKIFEPSAMSKISEPSVRSKLSGPVEKSIKISEPLMRSKTSKPLVGSKASEPSRKSKFSKLFVKSKFFKPFEKYKLSSFEESDSRETYKSFDQGEKFALSESLLESKLYESSEKSKLSDPCSAESELSDPIVDLKTAEPSQKSKFSKLNVASKIFKPFRKQKLSITKPSDFYKSSNLQEPTMKFKLSKSPVKLKLSESSVETKLSESSVETKLSESPVKRKFSELPVKTKLSESPVKRKLSDSPMKTKLSESSEKTKFAVSPMKTKLSESPVKTNLPESPVKTNLPESPVKTNLPESPGKTKLSESPVKTRLSESPKKTKLFKSPVKSNLDETGAKPKLSKPHTNPELFDMPMKVKFERGVKPKISKPLKTPNLLESPEKSMSPEDDTVCSNLTEKSISQHMSHRTLNQCLELRRSYMVNLYADIMKVKLFIDEVEKFKPPYQKRLAKNPNKLAPKEEIDWANLHNYWDLFKIHVGKSIELIQSIYLDFGKYISITIEEFQDFIELLINVFIEIRELCDICQNGLDKYRRFCFQYNEYLFLVYASTFNSLVFSLREKLRIELYEFKIIEEEVLGLNY